MIETNTVSPSHVMVTVSDYDRAVAFYTKALSFSLGFERSVEEPFETALQLHDVKFREGFMVLGNMMIALMCFERPESIAPPPHAFNRLGINQIAFSVSDIDAAAGLVAQHGGKVLEQTRQTSPFGTQLMVTDPDGTPLYLVQRAS